MSNHKKFQIIFTREVSITRVLSRAERTTNVISSRQIMMYVKNKITIEVVMLTTQPLVFELYMQNCACRTYRFCISYQNKTNKFVQPQQQIDSIPRKAATHFFLAPSPQIPDPFILKMA